MSIAPKPFQIRVPDEVLDDLRRRLRETRWPDEIPGAGWKYGTDLGSLRNLVAYWHGEYDWRRHEAELNAIPQFTISLNGIDLHFVHVRGEGPNPAPLLLLHGWPGSFYEYHKLIPLLTRPSRFGGRVEESFSVVVPSLPGHGFSFKPYQRRFGLTEMADVLAVLMTDVLGYSRFACFGHDWGAFLSSRLAYAYAEQIAGIYITLLAIPREGKALAESTDEERRFYTELERWLKEETGYSAMMGTKPQTLAYALTDSPAGLAGWIIEKFRTWSDCGGDVESYFGRDVLLTNIMLYWVTGAINSTFWAYYARAHGPWIVPPGDKIQVPTAYAEHPKEILKPPRSLANRMYGNIQRWVQMERGGHFPPLETPERIADEIRSFLLAGPSIRSRFKLPPTR